MPDKYICPKCIGMIDYSVVTGSYECKKCNYIEKETLIKKEQIFLNKHSINNDVVKLENAKRVIDGIKSYNLDSFYLSANNAKKDIKKKYNYIQKNISNTINELAQHNSTLVDKINNIRIRIFKELYQNSYFILNEVYGAYNVNSTPKIIQDILKSDDFYDLSRKIDASIQNIDLENSLKNQILIKKLTKEEIKYQDKKAKEFGIAIERIGGNALEMVTTPDYNKKEELKGEVIVESALIVAEIGINLIGKGIDTIGSSISNRMETFGKIRNTDKELDVIIKDVYKSYQELYDKINRNNEIININLSTLGVLEYSYKKLNERALVKLKKIPVYSEYYKLKAPLEKNKLFVELSYQITKQSLYMNNNFLKLLFKSKKYIFDYLWNVKVHYFFEKRNNSIISTKEQFLKLQDEVSETISSFKDIEILKNRNDEVFIELENGFREILKKDEQFIEIKNEVDSYIQKVFSVLKNKIR